jgi:membrane protease YdiL (CAAX protease family)
MRSQISTSMKHQTWVRAFSLHTYLLVVFAFSWPFQFFLFFWPQAGWSSKMLLVSMVMVAVGSFVVGRFVFCDSFRDAGWRWGRPLDYIKALLLPLFLWALPTAMVVGSGVQPTTGGIRGADILTAFVGSFLITLVPAFGEELGWRGYLLPRLAQTRSVRRALLVHAVIWWVWHLPVLVASGIHTPLFPGRAALSVGAILAISLVPSVMHAVVFAHFWSASGSLLVATVYHAAFDEVRDAIRGSIGVSPVVDLWQMLFLTFLGLVLLWRGSWRRLATTETGPRLGKGEGQT